MIAQRGPDPAPVLDRAREHLLAVPVGLGEPDLVIRAVTAEGDTSHWPVDVLVSYHDPRVGDAVFRLRGYTPEGAEPTVAGSAADLVSSVRILLREHTDLRPSRGSRLDPPAPH